MASQEKRVLLDQVAKKEIQDQLGLKEKPV